MPIMAAYDQSDVRGSARVLAAAAQKCLEQATVAARHVPTLNNLYRLLEAYRSHGFIGYEYEPRSLRGPEALTLLPQMDSNVTDLRVALDRAFKDVYGDQDREVAVNSVENVLRSAAYPESGTPAHEDREKALAFLKSFIDTLHPVR